MTRLLNYVRDALTRTGVKLGVTAGADNVAPQHRTLIGPARRGSHKSRQPPLRDLANGPVPGLTLRPISAVPSCDLVLPLADEGSVTTRASGKESRRIHLTQGPHQELSVESARELGTWHIGQAQKEGRPDPARQSVSTASGLTIQSLAAQFVADYVRQKQLRALGRYESTLRVHILPTLGHVLVDGLSREHARALVKQALIRVPRDHGARSRPHGGVEAARSAMSILRRMIGWAIEEGKTTRTDNPVTGMGRNLPRKRERERVLSLDEARAAWAAAGALGYPFGPAYQLLLLTGCRPGEWSNCRRSYLDLKQALLVVPASAFKSHHVHVVPLVKEAVRILEGVLRRDAHKGDYVFSGTGGTRPLVGWPKAQQRLLREICAQTGERVAVRWTPHDLRRTVATHIAENLGTGGEQLVRRVLGHSDGSVTAIYNRYGYVREMRAALETWSRKLLPPRNPTNSQHSASRSAPFPHGD